MVRFQAWFLAGGISSTASIYTVLLIGVDRFLGVHSPLEYGLERTRMKVILSD